MAIGEMKSLRNALNALRLAANAKAKKLALRALKAFTYSKRFLKITVWLLALMLIFLITLQAVVKNAIALALLANRIKFAIRAKKVFSSTRKIENV